MLTSILILSNILMLMTGDYYVLIVLNTCPSTLHLMCHFSMQIGLRFASVVQLHRIRGNGLARFVVFCPFVYLFVYVSLRVCTDLSSLYLWVGLHGFSRCHPSKAKPEAKTWISGLNLSPLPCKFHSTQSPHYKRHKINKAK